MNSCLQCGKEAAQGELYCPQCSTTLQRKGTGRFWIGALLFSASLLIVSALLLWHFQGSGFNYSWDDILDKPVATIDGEAIARADFRDRVNSQRRMAERQYGEDVFTGREGRDRLISLRRAMLDQMVEERLADREAQRLGISIPEGKLEQEMRRIAGEVYGSPENMLKMFKEEGISPSDLKRHVRAVMIVQALAETKAAEAGNGTPPDACFTNWLVQAKKAAQVTVSKSVLSDAVPPSGGCGCCGGKTSGGGESMGKTVPGPVDAQTESKARAVALAAYRKNNPVEKDVEVRVTDYGCHIQVDIEKGGRAICSYSYQDGKVTDN